MDDIPLPAVFLAYRISGEGHEDFFPLDVATEILASGECSRLYRALVYEQQLASEVIAYVESRQQQGCFIIAAFANEGRTCEELERALDAEIDVLCNAPVGQSELDRNLNRIETAYYHNLTSLSSRCERLAHYALFRDDPRYAERLLSAYSDVTAAAVHDVAQHYLGKDNRVVLHYLPRT